MSIRKSCSSEVSDDEWALVLSYLTPLPDAVGQREHGLRDVFSELRCVLETGASWQWMPNDLLPWAAVYQQARRWMAAGYFGDLRAVLRSAVGPNAGRMSPFWPALPGN